MDKALYLDRDGIVNVDFGYVHKKENFVFVPGIFDVCRFAKNLNYKIFIITNQSGIGRGLYSLQEFIELSRWVENEFEKEGIKIEKTYFCPHFSNSHQKEYAIECECRKPKTGMFLDSAKEYEIDKAKSIILGDKCSDIEAALNFGVKTRILVGTDFCSSMSYTFPTINEVMKNASAIFKN